MIIKKIGSTEIWQKLPGSKFSAHTSTPFVIGLLVFSFPYSIKIYKLQ